MQYTRLYADRKGQSHFERAVLELEESDYRPPAPAMLVSHAFDADSLQFVRLPAGWDGQSICPPERQFLICLSGQIEVTASDGKKRRFGPGDAVLMEDISGKGHRTRVRGGDEFLAAVVPLER